MAVVVDVHRSDRGRGLGESVIDRGGEVTAAVVDEDAQTLEASRGRGVAQVRGEVGTAIAVQVRCGDRCGGPVCDILRRCVEGSIAPVAQQSERVVPGKVLVVESDVDMPSPSRSLTATAMG